MTALSVTDLTLKFGGVTALDGVSFTAEPHAITAVIGPNGAGKTSLFNCLSGAYSPTSGSVKMFDTDVTRLTSHRIARLGLARTFQTPTLFDGLTVLENVLMGRYIHGRAGYASGILRLPKAVRDESEQRAVAEEILDLLQISHVRHDSVADLSYGMRKRVELGRALAQRPQLLLLDEPMAGMSSAEKGDMARLIERVRQATACAVLLVEHDMPVVMGLSSHVVVLEFGRKIADGTPDHVRSDPDVLRAYLGQETSAAQDVIAS